MPLLKTKIVEQKAGQPQQALPTQEQLAQVETAKKTVAKAFTKSSETMSKADWHDKDVRISRQGLFQAALQSVGVLQLNTGNTLEDYLKLVEQVADAGLLYVNRK
jgi:hypothetical protein